MTEEKEETKGLATTEKETPETDEEDALAEYIQKMVRASEGLPPKEPAIQYWIKLDELRERTIIKQRRADAHTFMRAVYGVCDQKLAIRFKNLTPEQRDIINPFQIFKEIVESEDHYGIAVDGRGRDYAVAGMKAASPTTNLVESVVPSVSGMQPQPLNSRGKGHWWNRNKEQAPKDSQVQ